jgi:hypothetical protein
MRVAVPTMQVEGSGEGPTFGYDYYNANLRAEDDFGGAAVVNSEDAEGECNRRRALFEADPVNSLKLSAFLAEKLHQSATVHGAALNAALSRLDATISGQLNAALGGAGLG